MEKLIMSAQDWLSEHAPWPVKYAPRTIRDVVLNKKLVQEIVGYVNMFRKTPQKLKHRALLLVGPPGVGKTSMAKAIAHSMHLELLEINASDDRSKDALLPLIAASKTRDFTGMKGFIESDEERMTYGKLILIDEVDGLSGTHDRGGLTVIISLIRQTRYPVLLTANDPTNDKIRTLLQTRLVKKIEFKKPVIEDIVTVLRRIADNEGIQVTDEVLHEIAELSFGDIRASINNFQTVCQGKTVVTMDDVVNLDVRDREIPIEGLLDLVFCKRDAQGANAATSNVPLDYNMFLLYFAENTYQYASDPEELAQLYDWVTKADEIMSRIRKRQHWPLLRYFFEYLTLCMALTKKKPTCDKQPRFPLYLVTLSRSKAARQMLKSISKKVAKKCLVTPQEALMDYVPVLFFIFQRNVEMAADLSIWFEFFNMESGKTKIKITWTPEIEFLAGTKERARKIQELIRKRIKDQDLVHHEAVETFHFSSPDEGMPPTTIKVASPSAQKLQSPSVEINETSEIQQPPSTTSKVNDTDNLKRNAEKRLPSVVITSQQVVDKVMDEEPEEDETLTGNKKKKKKKKEQKSLTDFFG